MKRFFLILGVVGILFGFFMLIAKDNSSSKGGEKASAEGGPNLQATGGKSPVVVMETSMGTIKIELNPDKAPVTVKNFLGYVNNKFYDGTIFHRVIADFMIQGGGFEPGLKEKTTRDPIKNEAGNGLSNTRGTIAMARTNDPDSATAQFFINVADNSGKLDPSAQPPGYCVFGKVIEGMDVVDKIRNVKTESRTGFDDVPADDVMIKSVRRADS